MQVLKSFFIILTLFVCTTSLQAQGVKGKTHQKGQHFEQLANELNLTDEQATQFKAIKKEMRTELKQLKGSGDRGAMKAVRTKYQTQINALLTPTQQEQLQALKGNRKGKGRNPEQRVQKHLSKMAAQLELSDAQIAAAKSILNNYATKRQELRNGEDRAGLKTLRKEQHEAVKAILTPTQLEQWETLAAERKANGKGKLSPQKQAKRMNRRVSYMTEQLNLSTNQTSQISAIFEKYADQKMALRSNGEKGNWKSFRKSLKQEINAVLTPEQATKWANIKGEHKRKKK